MSSAASWATWAGPRSARSRGEDLDPLTPGVLDGVGDQVGGVVVAATGHRDIGRGGTSVLTKEQMPRRHGLALGAVHGRGVGKLDMTVDLGGRQGAHACASADLQAAVVAVPGHSPGLPVGDIEGGVVAAGRDPVAATRAFALRDALTCRWAGECSPLPRQHRCFISGITCRIRLSPFVG
jgi:hypothetical protein